MGDGIPIENITTSLSNLQIIARIQTSWIPSVAIKMHETYHIIIIENPTKMRKVQLIPTIANVQKLMSPSSENH